MRFPAPIWSDAAMSSSRLATLLGPVIALLLIVGVAVVVTQGGDGVDDDFAADPTDFDTPTFEPSFEPTVEPSGEPSGEPTAEPTTDVTVAPSPAPTLDADGGGTSGQGDGTGDLGTDVAVDVPAVGGWVGGTPQTGTSVSAIGLPLLLLGGVLLWLRRERA